MSTPNDCEVRPRNVVIGYMEDENKYNNQGGGSMCIQKA
jgi:hypothetical protein